MKILRFVYYPHNKSTYQCAMHFTYKNGRGFIYSQNNETWWSFVIDGKTSKTYLSFDEAVEAAQRKIGCDTQ